MISACEHIVGVITAGLALNDGDGVGTTKTRVWSAVFNFKLGPGRGGGTPRLYLMWVSNVQFSMDGQVPPPLRVVNTPDLDVSSSPSKGGKAMRRLEADLGLVRSGQRAMTPHLKGRFFKLSNKLDPEIALHASDVSFTQVIALSP